MPSSAASRPAGGSGVGATATKTDEGRADKATGQADEAAPNKTSGGSKGDEKGHPPLELPTGTPESGPTKAQQARVPTADVKVDLPDGLTITNSCNGKNISPAISWRNVPPGTAELAIFAVSVQPIEGKLYFDWAMAGVDPDLSELKPGEVPQGAVLGRNGAGRSGYLLCPPDSEPETYIFSVYALPSSLSPQQGFDPIALRQRATRNSEEAGIVAVSLDG